MKIAFIGLGIMGSRMAANLLKNGIDLTVWNRSKEPVERLGKLGAKTANSIKEAVKEADLVFSMLSTPKVVEIVFLGEEGALSVMKDEAYWVDCSTVNPLFSVKANKEAIKWGKQFVDAPVAGSKPQAANGELVFFVGGRVEQLAYLEPYLKMMGKKVFQIGETSKGTSFKMLVNAMLAQSMIVFSETILLGEKLGIDKDFLLNVVPNLAVSAPFTKFKAEAIRTGNYEVQFPLELMHKDLHLAAITAYENDQPLHLANLAKELFAGAQAAGMGRLDFAAIHQFLEKK